jgi:PAS domain S-box-containing protein
MTPSQLRRALVLVCACTVAAIVGAAVYDSLLLRQQVMAANERELGNLTEALATGTLRSVEAVDVLLRDTASWYESEGRHLDGDGVQEALAARIVGVSQVDLLSVIDAKGHQRMRSRVTGEPLRDVLDRPYFTRQRDDAHTGLVIDGPIISRSTGVPALVLSRALRTPDGRFDGVVSAIVTLQGLQSMYESIRLGSRSALLLMLADGTIVARQPSMVDTAGRQRFPELVGLKSGGLVHHVTSPLDGRTKLVTVLGVGERPLILAVVRDQQQALEPWGDELVSSSIRTFLFIALVVGTTLALLRQLRRLEHGALALRESEERYAMAMEAANEGHAAWNIHEHSVFVSDKWRVLHGIAAGDIISTEADLRQRVVVHPDDADRLLASVDDHLEGRTPAIDVEYRVRGDDGQFSWIQARGRCVRDGAGAPSRLFCAANDITSRKEAEEARARFDLRVQQAHRMEALGTLAGGIAHDFNNILGAILGFGDMAQQQATPGTSLRRHIDRVLQAGGRAKALVRRVLEFSRSGVVEQVPVDIQRVVEEVLALLGPTLPPGMTLDATLAADSIAVSGDATQLHQVVMNLCTNAVQAMGDAGVLRVDLRVVEVDKPLQLLHGSVARGNHVRLCVHDTGPGFEPEALLRAFEPFFSTKKAGAGTGLGLSVVHGIVGDLGGAIGVESTLGSGAQMSVWLPIAAESITIMSRDSDDWPRGDGQVVMFVDDEGPLVEFGEELLAELGYSPLAFDSGQAALAAFREDPSNFDAVLTDESMPGMTGSELARAILAVRPDLPVIVMSGHVVAGLEERAAKAGVCLLLHKPLAARDLAKSLAHCLAART